ncbi:MAG: polysaccharide biosynthesis/export family protein [Roseovarius sp.]
MTSIVLSRARLLFSRAPRNASLILSSALILSACAGQMSFPVSKSGQDTLAAQNINVIRMSPENIGQYRRPGFIANANGASSAPPDPSPYTYRIGVGDQLRVQVWSDPERTQLASSDGSTLERGLVVSEQGEIFYPFVGSLRVSGRSAAQVRLDLTDRLRDFISDPQVEVSIIAFNAQQATVTGVVGTPGPVSITNVPKRLLDVINAAGLNEAADLSHVILRRRGSAYSVNLKSFIDHGAPGQNPIIMPGDVINVPPMRDNKIFTFGEISTTEITLNPDIPTSLTEVLANVGGIDRVRSDSRGIFVFRRTPSSPDGFDVFQFNMSSATALVLATDFQMAPLDIIFVTNDPITRWNDTISSLISPFGGLLQVRRVVDQI